jgi:hypothetical protein
MSRMVGVTISPQKGQVDIPATEPTGEEEDRYLSLEKLENLKAEPLGVGSSGEPLLFPTPMQTRIATIYGKGKKRTYEAGIVLATFYDYSLRGEYKTKKEAGIKALEASIAFYKKAIETAEADLQVLKEKV